MGRLPEPSTLEHAHIIIICDLNQCEAPKFQGFIPCLTQNSQVITSQAPDRSRLNGRGTPGCHQRVPSERRPFTGRQLNGPTIGSSADLRQLDWHLAGPSISAGP